MTLLQAAADAAEKSSGGSDFQIALVGLGGALVGALIGFVGVWIQTRQTARLAARAELRRCYEEFMVARDEDDAATKRSEVMEKTSMYQHGEPERVEDERVRAEKRMFRAHTALQVMAPKDTSTSAIIVLNADQRVDYLRWKSRVLFSEMIRRDTAARMTTRLAAAWNVRKGKAETWYKEAVAEKAATEKDIMGEPVPWDGPNSFSDRP